MALVQSVDGYGRVIDRSVARPYGYGRGLMSVDPAYAPFVSGRYAPVRVSYAGNTVRTDFVDPYAWVNGEDFAPVTIRDGTRPTPQDAARARHLTEQALTHGGAVPLPGSPRNDGTALVQQPESGGDKETADKWRTDLLNAANANPASAEWRAQNLRAPGTAASTTAAASAGRSGTKVTSAVGRPTPAEALAAGHLKNNQPGMYGTPSENWLVDASRMERVRDMAVQQYVTKNNEWAKGKAVPLGIPGESKYKGITKTDALASMMQVVAKQVPWQQKPADYSGQGFADKYKPGVQYVTYAPAFSIQSANNAYYDLGLWRNTPGMQGEITNWKRTFDALGLYAEGARPNLSSTGWGYYENGAMAEFMKIANSNPQAYQSVADLPKLRQELLDYAARAKKTGADGSGGSGGGQTYPFTQTNTTTNVQLSNMEDARETLRERITNMIGRFPTDAEVKQFLGQLNDYERGHPTKSTTTTTYSNANTATTNVNSDRGDNIDPFAAVQNFAQQQTSGDYHAYQQLRYYQAISDIMGSPQATQAIPQEK